MDSQCRKMGKQMQNFNETSMNFLINRTTGGLPTSFQQLEVSKKSLVFLLKRTYTQYPQY